MKLRLTLPYRDKFLYKLLHGKEAAEEMFNDPNSRITFATNIISEQLIENSAILLSLSVMWFFHQYHVLFNFGGLEGTVTFL